MSVVRDVHYNGNSMPIRKFKFSQMVPNPTIVMIAKRGSGKSVVTKNILAHYNDIPGGVILSPTDKMSAFYGKFFPDIYIHYEYKTEIIQNILYRQTEIIEKTKRYIKLGKKVDPRAFLIMDDCLADKGKWSNDKEIAEIFMNGRHYKLLYILTMQYPLGIGPRFRSNFDYIFILADDQYSNQKKIHEQYAGIFPTFQAFRQVFTQLTDDYGCMVIVNRGVRKSICDKVFWYKADYNIKIGKIGCSQFRRLHEDKYDTKWDRRRKDREIDINKILENKKSVVKVDKTG